MQRRFLDSVGVGWDRASRAEARDFSCWIQLTVKQRLQASRPKTARWSSRTPGAPNPVTGKPAPGDGYAPATVAHSETVLRRFYDFHRDAGTGPILNPFPLDMSRRARRARAHHNPMDEWAHERTGRYRPVVPRRIPKAIPDDWFNQLFAVLPSDRDRALVAFWISTGARASELLGMRQCDIDPGQQLISVVRKGSRARQQLPASADAFVWQRLYQQDLLRLGVPRGRAQPAWWTLRRPHRPLTYHAAHRMFERASAALGADWTLHDLRDICNKPGQRRHVAAGADGPARLHRDDPALRLAGRPRLRTAYEEAMSKARTRLTLPIAPAGRPIIPGRVEWLRTEMLKTRVAHGYCSRQLAAEACPYANICEQCDNYVTAPGFIPQLQAQLTDITALRDDAAERGWHAEVARHSRVIASIQAHLQRLTRTAGTGHTT